MKERLVAMLDKWERNIGYGTSESDVALLAQAIALMEVAEALRQHPAAHGSSETK
jgi:hypothetical protein